VRQGEAVQWGEAEPRLLLRAQANFIEQYRLLARWARDGAVIDLPGATLICTGYARDTLNPAIVYGEPNDLPALLARIRAVYSERGLPWCLRAIGPVAERLAAITVSSRLVPGQPIPEMLLAPLDCHAREVAGLEISRVTSEQDLLTFRRTVLLGFEMTMDVAEAITPAALLSEPDIAYYIGRIDDRAVATVSRVTSHRVAGIYNVSTLPSYRGLGIGAALTARAASDGLDDGCICASLQASAMGFGVYQRLGFRHVADYAAFRAR
jgi:N-acetylglutamate synthase